MTNQQMEELVERIDQRLRPPVLVMVTAAAGYRHAIRQRLAGCGESLHLALDSGIDDGEQCRVSVKRYRRLTGNMGCRPLRIKRCCCHFSTTRWRRIW